MHQAAYDWLNAQGFRSDTSLKSVEIYFELSREDKFARIKSLGCSEFIDDLPEFLTAPNFRLVNRVLFDPNDVNLDNDINAYKHGATSEPTYCPKRLGFMRNGEAICERLLTAAGHQGPFKLTPIVGGRNNRVSRVQRGEHSFLLKSFFHSADDPRDRYGAETRFYDFVDRNQIAQTPKLAATSHNDKAILMEFIEGSRVRPEDIGPANFACVRFCARL